MPETTAKQALEETGQNHWKDSFGEPAPVMASDQENWDSAFESADDQPERGYYLPPEGRYTGTIPNNKEGSPWVVADLKAGRIRLALQVADGPEKGRWVWGEIDTRHPDKKNCPTQKAAEMRISLMSRAAKAFMSDQSGNVTFKDKGSWTTGELTDYVETLIKMGSKNPVSFSVKHRTKADGTPDLITKGKNTGKQRYTVYINGPANA